MANEPTKDDRELLARLNGLKRSHIDLDNSKAERPVRPVQKSIAALDAEPSPGQALHTDLLSRFRSLGVGSSKSSASSTPVKSQGQSNVVGDSTDAEEDAKTVEELLAELGTDASWCIERDEETQINDLLHSARSALQEPAVGSKDEERTRRAANSVHELPVVDIEVFTPTGGVFANNIDDDNDDTKADEYEGDESEGEDDDVPRKSKSQLEAEINQEADAIVAKIKDELKNESSDTAATATEKTPPYFALISPQPSSDSNNNNNNHNQPNDEETSSPTFNFPSAPSKAPISPNFSASTDDNKKQEEEEEEEEEETPRISSLFSSLPSVPQGLPRSTRLAPTRKPPSNIRFGHFQNTTSHTDAEIDTWCTICTADATLTCPGCANDLYCTKCWLQGHRGEDSGWEERTHQARTFVPTK